MVVVIFVDKRISWHDSVLLFPLNLIFCFINLTQNNLQLLCEWRQRKGTQTFTCVLFTFRRSRVVYTSLMLLPPLCLSSLPPGYLQILSRSWIVSSVPAQQSLHHRGRHALRLPEWLPPWRHGQTRRRVHQWVTLIQTHTSGKDTHSTHLSVIIVFLRVI